MDILSRSKLRPALISYVSLDKFLQNWSQEKVKNRWQNRVGINEIGNDSHQEF